MEFYVNFMNHQEEQWEAQAAEATHKGQTGSGLHCYALRQREMWCMMAVQARQEFDNVHRSIHPRPPDFVMCAKCANIFNCALSAKARQGTDKVWQDITHS